MSPVHVDPPGWPQSLPRSSLLTQALERAQRAAEEARVALVAKALRELPDAELVALVEGPRPTDRGRPPRGEAINAVLVALSDAPEMTATTPELIAALPDIPPNTVKTSLRALVAKGCVAIVRSATPGSKTGSVWRAVRTRSGHAFASSPGEPSTSSPTEAASPRTAPAPTATASATAKPSSKANGKRG